MDAHIAGALDALGQAQHALAARWQLLAVGLTRTTIKRLVLERGWEPVNRTVLRMPGSALTEAQHLKGAQLAAAGPRICARQFPGDTEPDVEELVEAPNRLAALTGAAGLWGHGVLSAAGPPVHVASLCRAEQVTGVRVQRVDQLDVVERRGLPVRDFLAAIRDHARLLVPAPRSTYHLARILIEADGMRICAVEDAVEACTRPRLPRVLQEAAALVSRGFSHSGSEAGAREEVRAIAARYGLEVSAAPVDITLDGRVVAEADIAVLPIKLDLELDGPLHDLAPQVRRDRTRDERAARALWRVKRIPTEVYDTDREAFRAQVDQAIRDRIDELARQRQPFQT